MADVGAQHEQEATPSTVIGSDIKIVGSIEASADQLQATPVGGLETSVLEDENALPCRAEHGWIDVEPHHIRVPERPVEEPVLDPSVDAARIRAFFVHPSWARQGIGRAILGACEQAIQAAGFLQADLSATLAGEPLYTVSGYAVKERYEIPMANGLTLPVVLMSKTFQSARQP